MTGVPDPVTLPCGCFINCVVSNGVNEMRISPCRQDCPTLRAALDLAADAGKPVEKRVAP